MLHILRRALRSLWENAYLNAVSTGVITAALLLMGVYLTVQYNLNAIVDTWGRDVQISAYFRPEVPVERRFSVRDRIAVDPAVASVRYVSEADARAWLLERVNGLQPVLDELDEDVLPASLELTLVPGSEAAHNVELWASALEGPDFASIDYGQDWIQRFNAFLNLLKLLGSVMGLLVLLAALFLVTNTVYLVVYNRRDELEVQKLVGATQSYIVAPFLIEGMLHGLVGGLLSLIGLWVVHSLLVLRLQDALQLGIAGELSFLPLPWLALLVGTGVVLGVGAALVAVQRFLMQAP